jgi:hypothetical protein
MECARVKIPNPKNSKSQKNFKISNAKIQKQATPALGIFGDHVISGFEILL